MKAIKIDAKDQSVKVVEIEGGFKAIVEALGHGCELISAPVTYENEDTLYCDDEGLFKECQGAFMYDNWQTPIVNSAIILGCNEEGESIDVQRTVEEVKKGLHFIDKNNPSLVNYVSQFR